MTLEFRDRIPAFGVEVIGFDPQAPLRHDAAWSSHSAFDRAVGSGLRVRGIVPRTVRQKVPLSTLGWCSFTVPTG